MTPELIEFGKLAAAVVAIAGLIALGWKVARGVFRTVRRLGRMADEVLGDGDEHPGWGKRIAALEKQLGTVAAEVKPNHGSSMRDQINRIEEATGATPESGARP